MKEILIHTDMKESNSQMGRIERAVRVGSDVSTVVRSSKLPIVVLTTKFIVLMPVSGYMVSFTWIVKPDREEKC